MSQTSPPPTIDSIDAGFVHFSTTPSNMNEHFPALSQYAKQCAHVTELGSGALMSCWALLHGLNQSEVGPKKELVCVDIAPANSQFDRVSSMANLSGIKMKFLRGNSLELKLQKTEMLLIDTFHAYPQLKRELAKHESKVEKFIAILNTTVDGDLSELVRMFYHYNIDTTCEQLKCAHKEVCKGLRPAINEFLDGHRGLWEIAEDYLNNNGLIILRRIAER